MKTFRSKTGRKVILQDVEIPKDFGGKYRRELIESYDHAREERFFVVFSKFLLMFLFLFLIGVAFNYYF